MSKVRLYGSIEKVDEQEDGTIIVTGIASTEEVDSQGEIVTRAAMSNAIPDYMKFGAVREMHQPMAAGTALKCSVDEAGVTHLEAHIVDPIAVKKVLAQVYKGFSIGGKVKSRDDVNKNTITGLRLTEISLVDVPANPGAVFSLSKLADDEEEDTTEKKGARFSKMTKSKLSELHKAVATAKEHLDNLGYAEDGDGADDEADPKDKAEDDKAKEKTESTEDLQKLHTDTVAKVDALTAELAKAADEKTELLKQIEALKALPAAPKGTVTAVTKGSDVAAVGAPKEVEPIRKGDGTIDEVATLIKATHISAISAHI